MNLDLATMSGVELCLAFAFGYTVTYKGGKYKISSLERESGFETHSYNVVFCGRGKAYFLHVVGQPANRVTFGA